MEFMGLKCHVAQLGLQETHCKTVMSTVLILVYPNHLENSGLSEL